jgi:hypothetical protein
VNEENNFVPLVVVVGDPARGYEVSHDEEGVTLRKAAGPPLNSGERDIVVDMANAYHHHDGIISADLYQFSENGGPEVQIKSAAVQYAPIGEGPDGPIYRITDESFQRIANYGFDIAYMLNSRLDICRFNAGKISRESDPKQTSSNAPVSAQPLKMPPSQKQSNFKP